MTSIGEDAFENIDSDAVIYYEGTHEQLYNVTGYDNIPDSQLLCLSDSGNCGADGNNVTWKVSEDTAKKTFKVTITPNANTKDSTVVFTIEKKIHV